MGISLKVHFELETAHRLFDVDTYSEECRDNLHGHSYRCDVEVRRHDRNLNSAGMVCDFKKLKEVVQDLKKKYDHSVIIKQNDPLCESLVDNCKKVNVVDINPTAEWMCEHFAEELNSLFLRDKLDLEVVKLQVAETSGNIAVWRK